ncbi:MAG: hypothetical protein ACTJHU_03415 [Mycetocola sp.]
MVAELLKLRFRVLGNTLRTHPWQLIGVVVGGLYALGILAVAVFGLVAMRVTAGQIDPELRAQILVLAGSVVVLGWAIGPFLRAGGDDVLDASRFAHMPIALPQLLRASFVATLLGIPGIVTVVASLSTVIPWTVSISASLAALCGAALAVVICVLASRVTASLANRLAKGRRFREVLSLLILIPVILLAPLLNLIGAAGSTIASIPGMLAPVLSWTPLGAAWMIPADVLAGDWGLAALRVLISLASIAALALLWYGITVSSLGRPAAAAVKRRTGAGAGLFDVFPATPSGAIAARSLIYWFRDPRYSRQLVSVIVLPLVFILLGAFSPSGFMTTIAGPAAAMMLAITIYTDVSYDGSAYATHLVRSIRGRDDRWGRAGAALILGFPIATVATTASVLVDGAPEQFWPLLTISFMLLCGGVGLASISSAAVVMPVQKTTDNPFSTPPGSGGISLLLSLLMFVGLAVVSAPVVVTGIIAITTGSSGALIAAVVCTVVLAPAVLIAGVLIGGRVLDRRGPELLAQLRAMNA